MSGRAAAALAASTSRAAAADLGRPPARGVVDARVLDQLCKGSRVRGHFLYAIKSGEILPNCPRFTSVPKALRLSIIKEAAAEMLDHGLRRAYAVSLALERERREREREQRRDPEGEGEREREIPKGRERHERGERKRA
jgi:hypothetical protein